MVVYVIVVVDLNSDQEHKDGVKTDVLVAKQERGKMIVIVEIVCVLTEDLQELEI
jgi:hypothetical protein